LKPQQAAETSAQTNLQGAGSLYEGFFENVPSGAAILDSRETREGFNLVSSAWIDWKRFTLRKAPESVNKILFAEAEPVKCHGYITGTWIVDDLSYLWSGLKFFVVDAEFCVDGSTEKWLFVISPDALTMFNSQKRELK
jgi:hypothetical protein